jgi:translocation and assembly module TamB
MRRVAAIGAWILGSLVALIAVTATVVMVAGNTDTGRAAIERWTAAISAGHVQLAGLGGSFPRQLTLGRLQLSDAAGVWLTADGVALRWQPLSLLSWHVRIDSLRATRVHMERAPQSTSASSPSIPHIDVADGTIDVLELGAKLAGEPASLSVHGTVLLRSLQDATADIVAHRLDGVGEYTLHLRFDPARMDAGLALHEPAGGPLENVLGLPGLGALSATLNLSGPRASEQFALTLDVGELHGHAHGTLNLPQRSASLDYALTAPAMSPRPGLSWQRISLQGTWRGPVTAPAAAGSLEIEQLRWPGGAGASILSAKLAASAGMLNVRAQISGLQIPGTQPRLLQRDALIIDAALQLTDANRPLDLALTHRLFSLRAHALTVATVGAAQSVAFELRLPDVAPFAVLAGQDVRGDAVVTGRILREGATNRFTFDAHAGIGGGGAEWIRLLGNRPALTLAGTLNDVSIRIDRMTLAGRALMFTLSGGASRLPGGTPAGREPAGATHAAIDDIKANWGLRVSDLGTLSTGLAGTADITGNLSGSSLMLASDARLVSKLSVHGSSSGAISATAHVRGFPTSPSGTLTAGGVLDGAPLNIDLALERRGDRELHALIRRAEWKSVRVGADLTFGQSLDQTRGQLRVQVAELADLERLLDLKMHGSLTGTADFKPVAGGTQTQLNWTATKLAIGGFAGDAQLSGQGAMDALHLQLRAQSPDLGGVPGTLAIGGELNLDSDTFHLASIVASYRGQELRLLAPADVSFADGWTLGSLKFGAQQAVLQLDGRLSPSLDLNASLHKLGPALVNVFSPGSMAAGNFDASARIQGSASAPTGSLTLDGTGFRLGLDEAADLPASNLHVAAELKGDTAAITARLGAGNASSLTVSGTLPLQVAGAVHLTVTGKLELGLINPLLEARGGHATGQLTVDATIGGTGAAPLIGGSITLAQGSLRDYGRGVNLSDIAGSFTGSEGMLLIKTFSARAGDGSVSMTGTIGVLRQDVPLDLKLTARNAQPIASTLFTANLDADLHVHGNARGRVDVDGSVRLNRTLIGIPNTLPPNVAVLNVRRRGQQAVLLTPKARVIGLDLTIEAPQQMLVQGRGLDAELGGALRVGGTTEEPLVNGGFELKRGRFSLAGSDLKFTAGQVSFDGGGLKNRIDPTLDFTALSSAGDATTTLRITGHADSPKFEFSSNPPFPQDELMARLIFGVPADQLSALQLAQIGAALATLSGIRGNGGLNPLAKLQKSLGLDRLNVGAATTGNATGAENTGASIEAGRYVSKRVYVEAKQTTTGSSQVQVNVDLTKHLKLQTRLGTGTAVTQGITPENDPGTGVGLSYQFEF